MKFQFNMRHALLLAGLVLSTTASAQFFGGRGGGSSVDIQLLDQYDKDKNGYLDKAERQVAFQELGGSGIRRGRGGSTDTSSVAVNAKLAPTQVKSYPGKALYDPSVLRTVFINFEDSNWEAQMVAYKGTDIDMPATVVLDGKTYQNVGVHFRGNTSYMQVPDGYKRPLKLSFDMVDKKQKVLGYEALELLNAAQDPSYLRTILYMQIARDYVAAPKANYMRVVINGESWGVYVNSQPFNSDFVKEATNGAAGARWKIHGSPNGRGGLEYWGENESYYQSVFQITSKDKPESWAALINLTKVLNQTPTDKLEAALKPILDVDGVLRVLAVENALINNDGYWLRASDYSLYTDKAGMFHITPHDANETMSEVERMGRRGGGAGVSGNGVAVDPLVSASDTSKPLLSKLLAVPALKQRYLGYVRDIATKWLDWNKLGPIAAQYQALIAEDVKQDQRKLYSSEAFATSLTQESSGGGGGFMGPAGMSIKGFAEQRRAYLLNYFANSAGASESSRRIGI
ncbi:MAG: CotH kinase family protein [Steroidobacteraceae bacterium]